MFLERVLHNSLPGERVVFYLRRHSLTFLWQVLFYIILWLVPFVLGFTILRFFPALWDRIFNDALIEALVKLLISAYYLTTWVFWWEAWVNYYLDVWIVTTERIIVLEQHGLFNRTVAELRLSRVQDVSTQIKGLLGTMLGYGNVNIQTAGAENLFIFKLVPHAARVAEQVLRLADDWKHSHPNV
jgi:uncharacterized membrane protein YdbT with pleckstrin-like domain